MNITSISALIAVIGALVVIVNLLTEVIKKATWAKLHTNIIVVILSVILTIAAFFAYCQIQSITVVWYMVAAAVVCGFLVAYGAMFGFDKLKEALAQITVGNITGSTNSNSTSDTSKESEATNENAG